MGFCCILRNVEAEKEQSSSNSTMAARYNVNFNGYSEPLFICTVFFWSGRCLLFIQSNRRNLGRWDHQIWIVYSVICYYYHLWIPRLRLTRNPKSPAFQYCPHTFSRIPRLFSLLTWGQNKGSLVIKICSRPRVDPVVLLSWRNAF
jgi:hypothetical protein